MQSLTGAPRLLQAISADDVIPFLRPFQKADRRGEPLLAIFLTLCICELGILIAVIENITALITQLALIRLLVEYINNHTVNFNAELSKFQKKSHKI